MNNFEIHQLYRYLAEIEAAALEYASRYGLTPQMKRAVESRPDDSVFEALDAIADGSVRF